MEAFEEARNRARADRNVPPYLHVVFTQRAGDDRYLSPCCRIADDKQFGWEQLAKAPMEFAQRVWRCGSRKPALIDPFLDCDVSFGFELEIWPAAGFVDAQLS
ncbi:hypothetical protein GGQ63_002857 [Prosthecomicrobium pneumaticum]|uniref:Uncharacterized protein n=1 Tax=Prosthecomicrobium pneumaticum TaxID=81895 RepID=A0A7W9FN86_9HYPH|nr:hypothetical protein [Prosthecomicrobium pneumaticum]